MKHGPSREANGSSASQEIPRILWNQESHYQTDDSPQSVPILSHTNSVHGPNPTALRSILILSSFVCLGLPVVFSPQVFPPKPCMHLSSTSYMLHAPPISVSVAFTAPLLTNSTRDVSFLVCCSQAHVALAVCHTNCRTVPNLVLLYFKTVTLKTIQNQYDLQDFEAYKTIHT